MNATDQATVEQTVQGLTDDDRAAVIEIHRQVLKDAQARQAMLRNQAREIERAIEMRSYALELLGAWDSERF